jgi:phospholipase C
VNEHAITYKTTNPVNLHEVIDYYLPTDIPVFTSLVENFLLFDEWFAAVPGPTNPNRAYLTSGTSAGHGRNDNTFNVFGLTQKSIFQQLSENNITWMNYQNSTTGPG